ncbi:hypothetical protein OG948_60450 (plasmid) [Embleya sp. NBC_00888]|uniref:hypothetical protein n=1 Tax=Embleya sp. NBC_00888 TaxID=2975960 RepID=UPI0038697E39|nr:hypothetical protein OG948_60450 [Embleya sp. NBC_00888]
MNTPRTPRAETTPGRTGDADAGVPRHRRYRTLRDPRERRVDVGEEYDAGKATGRGPASADPAQPASGEPPRDGARSGGRADAPAPRDDGTATAPDVVTDHTPGCDGGRTSPCPRRVVWRIRAADASATWIFTCGIHLAWAACESAAGGHGRLDLRRITADEP